MNKKVIKFLLVGLIFNLLVAFILTSCDIRDDYYGLVKEGNNSVNSMTVYKFEYEGKHYIQFLFRFRDGGGITLDPDYLFKGDTISYEGQKYVKIK